MVAVDLGARIEVVAGPMLAVNWLHRHNDIEFIFTQRGTCVIMMHAHRLTIRAGHALAIWAAVPHQCVEVIEDGNFVALHIPMNRFLSWKVSEPLRGALLRGEALIDPGSTPQLDEALFAVWHAQAAAATGRLREAIWMEVEARFRRLDVNWSSPRRRAESAPHTEGELDHADRMSRYIMQHFTDAAITIADVASATGLHPRYAIGVFRKTWGTTPADFMSSIRVCEAQRLLAVTDKKVIDVAMSSGFGSVSQMHATFRKRCGCSPAAYRQAVQDL